MPSHFIQFPKLKEANSAGAETKLPGEFNSRFDFRRMTSLPDIFSADFEAIQPLRAATGSRGTRVAKQETP